MKKNNIFFNILKWIIGIILGLVIIIILGARIFFRSGLGNFYKSSTKAYVIPGLNNGFVPQGIDYDERTDMFFMTGYDVDDASPIYLISKDGNTKKYVELLNMDGSDFNAHTGGILVHGDYIYIAGCADNNLHVFGYDEIVNANNREKIACRGVVKFRDEEGDYINIDSVTAKGDYLYVTEYYRYDNFLTADSHAVTTSAGAENHALCVKFSFNDKKFTSFGIDMTPVEAYSVPDIVQGVTFDDNKMFLSRSYGASKSIISVYDIEDAATDKTIEVLGAEVPLYELDEKSLIKDSFTPAMSEEIVIVDGRLYIQCESASNKYIFGKLVSGEYLYATKLDYFE